MLTLTCPVQYLILLFIWPMFYTVLKNISYTTAARLMVVEKGSLPGGIQRTSDVL